jgi:hypothetical protein
VCLYESKEYNNDPLPVFALVISYDNDLWLGFPARGEQQHFSLSVYTPYKGFTNGV